VASSFVFDPKQGCFFDPINHLDRHTNSDILSIFVDQLACKSINSLSQGINNLLPGTLFNGIDPLLTGQEVHELFSFINYIVTLNDINHAFIELNDNIIYIGESFLVHKLLGFFGNQGEFIFNLLLFGDCV